MSYTGPATFESLCDQLELAIKFKPVITMEDIQDLSDLVDAAMNRYTGDRGFPEHNSSLRTKRLV